METACRAISKLGDLSKPEETRQVALNNAISAYSEQVQPQIRSGWDETEDEYVEIKRAFEFGFHEPLIP